LDLSLDPKWVPFPDVLFRESGELIPKDEPVPVGYFFTPGFPVRCEGKGRNSGASLGRANLWIHSDVADQFDAIKRFHFRSYLSWMVDA